MTRARQSTNDLRIDISVPDGRGDVALSVTIGRARVTDRHRVLLEQILRAVSELAAPVVQFRPRHAREHGDYPYDLKDVIA
ncbi:MAG: hypothetical protein ABJA80_01940 [bacterium]